MNLSERVAAEIRAEMARQRRSGNSVAAALGWSHMYLSRRLSGRAPLRLDDVEAIAAALGVPVTAFFDFPGGQLMQQQGLRTPGWSRPARLMGVAA